MNFLPQHLSFSSLSSYESCPRQWYLARVRHAEERQTWFFPIGSAVHASIESYIASGVVPDFEGIFYPLVVQQMQIDPDDLNWLAGGPKDDPFIRDKAVQLGKDCVERAVTFLEDVTVHEVEYDATGMLPGCEVPIKAFVDILGEHKKHGPVIVDWKSSASKPKTNLQLEVYRALLSNQGMQRYTTGLWAMLRPGTSKARPVDLSSVDPSALGARFQKCYDDIKARIWKTNHSFDCNFCIQQDNCLLVAGPTERANFYDRAVEDGFPF